jgi:hypothetical protein
MSNWQLIKRIWGTASTSAGGFSKLKWLGAALGSSVAAYVLGGVVLALRLEQAGFPVQDGISVIPPSAMLVTGVRELIITVFVGAILLLVVVGMGALSHRLLRLPEEIGIGFAVLALVFLAPLSAAGLAWPFAVALLGAATFFAKHLAKKKPGWVPSLTVTALLLLATIATVTLARYTSPPYKFAVGWVLLKPEEGKPAADRESYGGAYLGRDSDYVYLASQDDPASPGDETRIIGYARDSILTVSLLPPPPPVSAPTSLIEKTLGVDFSITPQGDVWSDGAYEGWRLFR